MIFFTADYHLGHANIIQYCNRPFGSVEEMDETIIGNHNDVVANRDTVFFLGDLCFGRIDRYWERLNGNLIFIEGNHDRRISLPYRVKFAGMKVNGKRVLMCHRETDILSIVQRDDSYDFYLVAHSHDTWKFKDRMINVGCDNWNFKPIKFDYMMREYRRWEKKNNHGRVA